MRAPSEVSGAHNILTVADDLAPAKLRRGARRDRLTVGAGVTQVG